jgi:tetratricopeptide (TPR) repeat protein
LAALYQFKKEYTKAELFFTKALKITKEILGDNHPNTASSYRNIGLFYQEIKECIKAREYLEKAMASVEEVEYSDISLIDLRRELRDVEKSMAKEKKAKFNKKGKFCVDVK